MENDTPSPFVKKYFFYIDTNILYVVYILDT